MKEHEYAYLAGFCDADGSVKYDAKHRVFQIQFWNTCPEIIDGICDILQSNGVYHYVEHRKKKDGCKQMYNVCVGRLAEIRKLGGMLKYIKHPVKHERLTALVGMPLRPHRDPAEYPVQEWVQEYQAGGTFSGIARKWGYDRKTVTREIKRAA